MRKVQELTTADFPNLDGTKFEEWKQSIVAANRNLGYLGIFIIAVVLISYFAFDVFAVPGLLLIIVPYWLILRKPARLYKELGLTRKALREARQRTGPPMA